MFKNAIFFKLTEVVALANLQDQLANFQSREPGAIEYFTQGFIAPDKNRPDQLVRYLNGAHFIRLKTIEKILPASVINDYLEKEIEELESTQQCKIISKKERRELRDKVILGLLQDAFTKSSYTEAFIDTNKGLIVVNAASFKKAEDVLTLLRKALGRLPARPIDVEEKPSTVMTKWVGYFFPDDKFKMGGKFSLVASDAEGKKARFTEFGSTEIESIIENGAIVTSMSLENSDLAFTIDEDLRIKGIKDVRQDQIEYDENENPFEADCIITHGLITKLFDELIAAFGSEKS
jgi:recombination associated protein RdgC